MKRTSGIAVWAALVLIAAGCDGRSIGVVDPGNNVNDNVNNNNHRPDASVDPLPDSGFPPGPDGNVVTCTDSPLQGIWRGGFEGNVASPDLGSMYVFGTVRLEIFCEFDLTVSGELTGSESTGVPFRMDVSGLYDEDTDTMDATFTGDVSGYPAFGTLRGRLNSGSPPSLAGDWDVQVPSWNMTGHGTWNASLQ